MNKEEYIHKLLMLHENATNLARAAEIGDIESAIQQLEEGAEIVAAIQSAWQRSRSPYIRLRISSGSKVPESQEPTHSQIYRGPIPGDEDYDDDQVDELTEPGV